jgi:hypothetical protein
VLAAPEAVVGTGAPTWRSILGCSSSPVRLARARLGCVAWKQKSPRCSAAGNFSSTQRVHEVAVSRQRHGAVWHTGRAQNHQCIVGEHCSL